MGKIAFLFAGQGAQKIGMGRYLLDLSPAARDVFDLASQCLGYDVRPVLFEGPEERLAQTEMTQPAILTATLATHMALLEKDIRPDMAAGLSLGEYGALVASGSLLAKEAFPLVRDRGRYMQEAVPLGMGGMVAVLGMESDRVEEICRLVQDGVVEPANYNCPGQIVVAGDSAGLENFKTIAREQGARRLVDLPVSAPFHSSLLKPAGDRLKERFHDVQVQDPQIPVYANLTARPVKTGREVQESLIQQVYHPVRFEQSLRNMIEDGADTFVEIGPGKGLGGFVRKVSSDAKVYHTDDLAGFEAVLGVLEGKI